MKNKRVFSILLLFIMLLCVRCTFKDASDSESQMLTVNFKDVKDTVIVPLSSLVENCKLIKFENSDTAMFKKSAVIVSDNYIGIRQNGGRPFKLFDHAGKFLCDVGSVGQGPGEYSDLLYDEYIDEANKKIYIMEFAFAKKLFVYDLDGKFINSIPLTYTLKKPKIKILPDQTIAIVHMPFQDDKSIAMHYSQDGKILNEIIAEERMKVKSFDGEMFALRNTKDFNFMHTSIDTLLCYDLSTHTLKPKFTMTFPNPEKKPMHIYGELPSYYLTTVFGTGIIGTDKKKKTSHYIKIVNDFYGGMDVSPYVFNNGWLAYVISPMDLRDKIEERLAKSSCSEKDKKQLQPILDKLDDDDNDLIFIGKLKQ